MEFNLIDIKKWERKEYFEHYTKNVSCTYSLTTDIDVTLLLEQVKHNCLMLYPVLIYMLSKIINQHQEFRTCLDDQGKLGYWEKMNPSYTVFHDDNQTFSELWSEYSDDFMVFYRNYITDVNCYGEKHGLIGKPKMPANVFNISCLPWINFTSFNLNLAKGYDYLLPIFTWGKFVEKDDKVLMPLSIQAHHGVCDGFHIGRLVCELQAMSDECSLWLK